MSVLLGVSKETVASCRMAADRSTGHRRYQDEAERSGPPVVFLVIQIISPCLPVVEGSVRPLDDFHETARAKKNAGILSRRASRRRFKGILATISATPRTRRTAVCVPREAHARPGEFPLVHHPEEQPVEIGLERDQAVIALARSRARGC